MKIVHISDLHVFSPNFVPEWGEKVIHMVNSLKPEILVVTGDLTDEGHQHEYEEAKAYLNRIKVENKIVVPGNHDARNEGYVLFEDIFKTRYPVYEDERVVILGIDSSEPDIDEGHIGREIYDSIKQKLPEEEKIKILAMHHHLIPIPGTGRERYIPVDAGDALKLCVDTKVNFVLSGHKHKPWTWKLEDTYLITAGTATSRRLKGRSHPSYNVLEIEDRKATLKEVNVTNQNLEQILSIAIT
ncbi:MAG: metallophosphoesterase [Candidatus Zixiibacteriota bacterium]